MTLKKAMGSLCLCIAFWSPSVFAGVKTIGIYKIEAGKQLQFMQWMAAWDKVYAEIGLAQPQWYRSVRGADWDFVVIYPPFDRAKEAEMERVGKRHGLDIGFRWKLKYWEFVSSQSESLAQGPTSPAVLIRSLAPDSQ
ncbi:hypothetical protein HBA55_06195 [Pseudomaricurvus alkylphenolicus]|uniref:hypothetical protein n=1 Tax=Pseudomaricurvus alkylphenolicus TaxID=1306991 RepID=UPI0014240AEC|nr:hypothetical protein [Pseudomaricurvus alkylphenolicus]NIB39167.1 hypothetical protein [Pseudomaricurvus alkylphenolicus]